MDKLTKDIYREALICNSDYLKQWREGNPFISADVKIAIIRTEFEMMKELYKLDNEKE